MDRTGSGMARFENGCASIFANGGIANGILLSSKARLQALLPPFS